MAPTTPPNATHHDLAHTKPTPPAMPPADGLPRPAYVRSDTPSRGPDPAIAGLWTDWNRIRTSIEVWLSILKAQTAVDPSIATVEQLADYRTAYLSLVTGSDARGVFKTLVGGHETHLRHRLLSILRVFEDWAGNHGKLHLGLTSHDIEETVEYHLVDETVHHLLHHLTGVIRVLADLCEDTNSVTLVARTHGQPAQATTLGRRFAPHLESLIQTHRALHAWRTLRPVRPLAGAVGTGTDLYAVLGDRQDPHTETLHRTLANPLTADRVEHTPRQTADRLWLHDLGSILTRVGIVAAQIADQVRLMALQGLARERPTDDQVGSSAMAHKTNPRYSERVVATSRIVTGYARMVTDSIHDIRMEGDVAGSAVQRQALPELLQQTSILLSDLHWVVGRFEPDFQAIEDEIAQYAELLSTGLFLAAAVRAGMPRERAHEVIRLAAHESWDWGNRRYTGARPLSIVRVLHSNPHFPLDRTQMKTLVGQARDTTRAQEQTMKVVLIARALCTNNPGAGWDPGERL